jgi:hypothetical protein
MNKRSKTKLTLTTETIKTIAGNRLDRVAGGAWPISVLICPPHSEHCPTGDCLTLTVTLYTHIDC